MTGFERGRGNKSGRGNTRCTGRGRHDNTGEITPTLQERPQESAQLQLTSQPPQLLASVDISPRIQVERASPNPSSAGLCIYISIYYI